MIVCAENLPSIYINFPDSFTNTSGTVHEALTALLTSTPSQISTHKMQKITKFCIDVTDSVVYKEYFVTNQGNRPTC